MMRSFIYTFYLMLKEGIIKNAIQIWAIKTQTEWIKFTNRFNEIRVVVIREKGWR